MVGLCNSAELVKHLYQVLSDHLGVPAFYVMAFYKVNQFSVFKQRN
jgi:hypothetical protein